VKADVSRLMCDMKMVKKERCRGMNEEEGAVRA
jgi:hypothetical protein